MFLFTTLMVALVALTGVFWKQLASWLARKDQSLYGHYSINMFEFGTALLIISTLVGPATYAIGKNMSVASQLKHYEYYNGVETFARENIRDCRSGRRGETAEAGRSNCHYDYVCGRYTYTVVYYVDEPRPSMNSKGEIVIKMERVRKTREEPANIYCPYMTREYTYTVLNTLPGGERDLPSVYAGSTSKAWDNAVGIPASIPVGPPKYWAESKRRIDSGDRRSVTGIFEYDNYLLASRDELLLPYSDDVDRYKSAGILPEHTKNATGNPLYGPINAQADKLSFVGIEPPGGNDVWQEALMGLNGAVGLTLRGDVHMVVIDAKLVDSKVNYVNALKAYWLGEDFGKYAIAKNAIIVVIGVTDNNVVWAEATTGMPFGNEVMLESISGRFISEKPQLKPGVVIGDPRVIFEKDMSGEDQPKAVLAETPGILEQVILRDFPFARASMTCNDDEDGASCVSFADLVSEIQPSLGAKLLMGLVVMLISTILWGFAATHNWLSWLPSRKKQSDKPTMGVEDEITSTRSYY